jgi:hypothetical protein
MSARWRAPKSLRDCVRSIKVASCANGDLIVTPDWNTDGMDLEPDQTAYGVFTRMGFAAWLQEIANRALK